MGSLRNGGVADEARSVSNGGSLTGSAVLVGPRFTEIPLDKRICFLLALRVTRTERHGRNSLDQATPSQDSTHLRLVLPASGP